MNNPDDLSYDVRIWTIRVRKGKRGNAYGVRWSVAGKQFHETFATAKLAESYRSKLTTAAREGVAFDKATGLPEPMARTENSRTWYEHACAFVDMKWPHASGRHRRSISEALATVTPALLTNSRGAPSPDELRKALYGWAFNKTARLSGEPSDELRRACDWVAQNTVSIARLTDATIVRKALDQLALKLDGSAAAPTTIARKRAVFYGALNYAVEQKMLSANPIDLVDWKTPKDTESIDRRVVVNPQQARDLFVGVRSIDPALEAFFGCLYLAALRPAEAKHLAEDDCTLPETGWGELHLVGSTQHVGTAWGDSGEAQEDRGLKHRAKRDTRIVPACPELVQMLRKHIDTFGTGPDGRLFITRTGKHRVPVAAAYANPVSNVTYSKVWRAARKKVLTPYQAASPLAARPYDLRHAGVSLWLNAGVPATQVAEWAGHGVHVLLKVYAKCIYGQDEAAKRRIETALKADYAGSAAA